jgi:NADH:ubiquinone oxidoreductase subunit 4 (subunit M)
MALCGEFLITVGGFAEFYLWRLLVTGKIKFINLYFLVLDQEICYLDKQKLDLETRIVSVDARLVDNLLLIAVAESYGSIK